MSVDLFPKLSILLALSNGQAAEAFKPILRSNGVGKAIAVESNYDALAKLKEQNFNMIVIDDRFPELGGFDFCRFLRLTNISVSVAPIILGLHNPDQNSVLKARDAGATKIVAMPLTGQTLIKAVSSTLNEIKPIVQDSSYNGPDRRRVAAKPYSGPERRKDQSKIISVEQQRRAMFGIKS
ncbi:MAG: response regulator [Kordiimonadaceae bacterium]|nr:response regulator [Kordiimonadaceae bacterium]MBO6569753.1 response regulator [Kordiimonadaceae bacterium]MBO6966288.1 response regulator [Kordiimonadaceae bacterium]